jgi:dihydroorotate dehydrogenase (fumarate)
MADLSVRYLGLKLPHPLIAGASPLADSVDSARRLEEGGAAALVLRSLFEEEIAGVADPGEGGFRPDDYIAHLERVKAAVRIPVLGSLNGSTRGGWLDQARRIERAGADALELNLYLMATDEWDPPQVIERRTEEILRAVKGLVEIPVAVKLSPYYTSLPHLAQRLDADGADGLVLFNRYCLPDLDLETGTVVPGLPLSDSTELPLRLHAMAILYGRLRASLAVSGGVESATDALKAVASGAYAVQMVSSILRHGPDWIRRVRDGMSAWLDAHGHASLDSLRGTLSLARCPDPHAWQRAHYLRVLRGSPA